MRLSGAPESTIVDCYHKAACRTEIAYVKAAGNAGVVKVELYVDGKLEATAAGAHKLQWLTTRRTTRGGRRSRPSTGRRRGRRDEKRKGVGLASPTPFRYSCRVSGLTGPWASANCLITLSS